ncbi:type II toxin-antitoxin system death-on-curing family toxin [Ligilactobacillus salivarius]|uniref:type II toxin-antitoxin system death-on-curing family toxin n=1 Tax=Ligilactobacillus salivarius TaxID=1624 RepID=UPI001F507105|nr:type II toxin-antitoxin system death-on-curing family toxin [Ligilactobacillus salivarius]
MEIDGVLYIPNFSNERQQEEFKEIFARSLNLDKVDKKDWKININTYESVYSVELLYDSKVIGLWIVFDIPFQKIDLELLKNLNEKAEKMFREEWFYGIKDADALKALLARVDNGFFGIEPYPTTISKAKVFWYTIATKQMFNNGNKRTALLTALTFLRLNGYNLDFKDSSELYNISMDLANKIMSEDDLEQYLLQKTQIDFEQMEEITKMLNLEKISKSW